MSILLFALLGMPALAGPYDEPAPLFGGAQGATASAAVDPTSTEDPFRWVVRGASVAPGGRGQIELQLVVPQGTHVYRDMLSVDVIDADGLSLGKPDFPPGRTQADPANGGKPRELYDMDVIIYVPVKAPRSLAEGDRRVRLSTGHQGCREGLCFPPGTHEHVVNVPIIQENG